MEGSNPGEDADCGGLEEKYPPDSIKILDSTWLKFYIALDMIVVAIQLLILSRFTSSFRQEE
jgi:hypothetical protein